jgi:hypothetical protein
MGRLTFYNLQVARDRAQVVREVRALIRATRPVVLGLCEATGYQLPHLAGYTLARDRSTPSRANVAASVRDDAYRHHRWHDLDQTWTRTEHPGTHEPRSWLEISGGPRSLQVLVGHQPPKGTDNTLEAQREGLALLERRMTPWRNPGWVGNSSLARLRPRVVLMDANRRTGEPGPGPDTLAAAVGGQVVGRGIDCAVIRHGNPGAARYVRAAAGVTLGSDHERAFTFLVGGAGPPHNLTPHHTTGDADER